MDRLMTLAVSHGRGAVGKGLGGAETAGAAPAYRREWICHVGWAGNRDGERPARAGADGERPWRWPSGRCSEAAG